MTTVHSSGGTPVVAVPAPFVTHIPEFGDVLGPAPRLVRVIETDAHEGPVYCADEDALYATTTPRKSGAGTSIVRVALDGVAPVGPGTGGVGGLTPRPRPQAPDHADPSRTSGTLVQ